MRRGRSGPPSPFVRAVGNFVPLLLFTAFSACADRAPAPSREGPALGEGEAWEDPFVVCETDAEPSTCATRVEGALIASAESAARSGDTLSISGSDGARLRLIDGEGGAPIAYRYLGYVEAIDQHVVRVSLFEGSDHVLVDGTTTNQTHVLGYPVMAPGGARFATSSFDMVAGHDPNGLQIWRVHPDRLSLEWEIRGGSSWGPEEVRWVSDSALRFVRVVAGPRPARVETVLTVAPDSLAIAPRSPS